MLLDATTVSSKHVLFGHTGTILILSLASSFDETFLVSGSEDKTVGPRDAQTREVVKTEDGKIRWWDVRTEQCRHLTPDKFPIPGSQDRSESDKG